ncbi:MAG: MBL fold metallo-hydrolase [Thermoplasmata archaeon]|nr:MBL fold metallo-hydrolase [Thermoplasmata archaeon]
MKVQFLGGGQEVGRLGILVENDGAKALFDYGITATDPPSLPMEAPALDAVFLTHSHLDHCGMIPWLSARYDIRVFSTELTKEISILLMFDSIKVGEAEGYPQPYDKGAVRKTMSDFVPLAFGESIDALGFEITTHSAGHIPGATMYELKGRRTTLVTGDFHSLNQRVVWGAHPVKCDDLIIESTYAGREHPDRLKEEYRFLRKVEEVVERGGTAIVPSFAVGRTQELMLLMRDSEFDYWVDGMGKTVTKLYLEHPEFLRSAKKLANARRKGHEVRSPRLRAAASDGEVIITTSGMLDGGPVLGYLEKLKNDENSAILLTGYQVEGSNGRRLMDSGMLDIQGQLEKIAPEVEIFDFSAHAGHSEVIEFVKSCSPERVVLMHGDNRELLAEPLRKLGFEVLLPMNGETFEL